MSTPKENFLRLMRNDNPKWLGDPWDCYCQGPILGPIILDAITMTQGRPNPGEGMRRDRWGIMWDWPLGQPGAIPVAGKEYLVLQDIHEWREKLNFNNLPPEDKIPWGLVYQINPPFDRENKLLMVSAFMGMFEFAHLVLGFEQALVDFMLEQEEMYAMLEAYTDWKIKTIGMVIDNMQPDIIHSQDDWGDKHRMFLPPTVWREMIKPHYERYYGYIKSRGVLIQHHSDCVNDDVAEDMVELGIDMWQGVIPQNDIKGVIERTEGKLCIMGGFDMQLIDYPWSKEEDIRAYVRQVIDTYMPLGSFIPTVTNVIPINKHVENAIHDELNRYGAEYAAKHF
ncbi:MAG TPA: hypothetical protein GXZ65_02225 [Clostridiales bacterium]|jgi:hypothetical protein|nr:hypothetical protein [Clostridiales bacterium]